MHGLIQILQEPMEVFLLTREGWALLLQNQEEMLLFEMDGSLLRASPNLK